MFLFSPPPSSESEGASERAGSQINLPWLSGSFTTFWSPLALQPAFTRSKKRHGPSGLQILHLQEQYFCLSFCGSRKKRGGYCGRERRGNPSLSGSSGVFKGNEISSFRSLVASFSWIIARAAGRLHVLVCFPSAVLEVLPGMIYFLKLKLSSLNVLCRKWFSSINSNSNNNNLAKAMYGK